ncbi:MAG: chemotaxis protein CheA [Proteobacteria bacterium]|nr:chemotaxis protein CheA [Pseudomonadota bacterium]
MSDQQQLLEGAMIALDGGDQSDELLNTIFRAAHSFKGSSKTVGFDDLSKFAHKFEDVLSAAKSKKIEIDKNLCTVFFKSADILKEFVSGLTNDPGFTLDASDVESDLLALLGGKSTSQPTEQHKQSETIEGLYLFDEEPALTPQKKPAPAIALPQKIAIGKPSSGDDAIRVSVPKLDRLLNSIGELVVNQTMLNGHRTSDSSGSEHARAVISYMQKIVSDVQEQTMALRMIPVKPLFQKMQRAVRDASTHLNKDVLFESIGDFVELDKTLVEKMTDPINHLVRNCVDHGIETAEERQLTDKPLQARVTRKAEQKDDVFVLSIIDDGRGLNRDTIFRKAVEKGLVTADARLSDDEIHRLIFQPGFSTKDQVSEISGRGVGLDVVQRAVDELKGSIQLHSRPGQGSEFVIVLPLSLSIISGMIIRVADQKYIVPVSQLLETVHFSKYHVEDRPSEGRLLNLRGEIVPIYSLASIIRAPNLSGVREASTSYKPGLITSFNGRKVSFEVEEILGQQQVVLKPLGNEIRGIRGITAAAILTNGDPGLVLNLHEIAERRSQNAS